MKLNNTSICSFRARMKKRGYTDIHIKYNKDSGAYNISAVEPLGKTTIYAQWSAEAMFHGFRF